ncbi:MULTISPECIES: DUF4826 family protein [unclassified Novosphingobium]|uniref:DUF4826 family protein n=1 Tax=unclassified Novosphingobium TaxID=2644732 RepID=UPI00146B946F|nr:MULTISPECIES: DUF4826 family protein [unclassified Novosphingobium]NMN87827.1 hypothetical protein [Novosphingobium sp. SG916]
MTDDMSDEDEDRWCAEQRANVIAYLAGEKCASTSVGEWPAWYMPPLLSVWAVESAERPGSVGWWAISGDFPTDYTECRGERHPRQGLRDIGRRWQIAAEQWLKGETAQSWRLGDGKRHAELAPLLAARAKMFLEIAEDDAIWDT